MWESLIRHQESDWLVFHLFSFFAFSKFCPVPFLAHFLIHVENSFSFRERTLLKIAFCSTFFEPCLVPFFSTVFFPLHIKLFFSTRGTVFSSLFEMWKKNPSFLLTVFSCSLKCASVIDDSATAHKNYLWCPLTWMYRVNLDLRCERIRIQQKTVKFNLAPMLTPAHIPHPSPSAYFFYQTLSHNLCW